MKSIQTKAIAIAFFFLSGPTAWAGFSGQGTITSLRMPANGARVDIEFSKDIVAGKCKVKGFYTLPLPEVNSSRILSLVTTAFASDSKVQFTIDDKKCAASGAAKINRVKVIK